MDSQLSLAGSPDGTQSVTLSHLRQTHEPLDYATSWDSINVTTYIQGRSKTSYTAPCNGVISHGAQIGCLLVFTNHTRKSWKASTIFMHFTCVHLHAQTAVDAGDICNWQTMVILLQEKKWRPQFDPHAVAQVLGSPLYICEYQPNSECTLKAVCQTQLNISELQFKWTHWKGTIYYSSSLVLSYLKCIEYNFLGVHRTRYSIFFIVIR